MPLFFKQTKQLMVSYSFVFIVFVCFLYIIIKFATMETIRLKSGCFCFKHH